MERACAVLDSLRPYHHYLLPRDRPRCLGVAVEAAHLLLQYFRTQEPVPEGLSDRVTVMLGGPLTVGPGYVPPSALDGPAAAGDEYVKSEARKYFRTLATDLQAAGARR